MCIRDSSNGAPKNVRPIMDSALVAMAMMQGLTSAIVNPNDLRQMETIKSCDIFKTTNFATEKVSVSASSKIRSGKK